jgi:pimeloyl-ACP methyl ester carboxylesterase
MDFDSDGVRLHYEIHGPELGPPLVLVHGFASSYRMNWVGTRWQETLTRAGFRVIGLDCRGHGESEKPHAPSAYSMPIMAADVLRLIDHLGVPAVNLLGFSMGARIGLQFVLDSPQRVVRAVLGGMGIGGASGRAEVIAEAFLTGRPSNDAIAQTFYRFASAQPTNDLGALAACILGLKVDYGHIALASIRVPILLVVGDRDDIAGNAEELIERVPTARLVTVAGRDHLGTVPAREFKRAAVDFLTAE